MTSNGFTLKVGWRIGAKEKKFCNNLKVKKVEEPIYAKRITRRMNKKEICTGI